MKLAYGAGCVDIEVEVEDVGKRYRVSDPGWNETMDSFEVEELDPKPQPEPERDPILASLDGWIADAEAALGRKNVFYDMGYWKGSRDTLINCKRLIERKGA